MTFGSFCASSVVVATPSMLLWWPGPLAYPNRAGCPPSRSNQRPCLTAAEPKSALATE